MSILLKDGTTLPDLPGEYGAEYPYQAVFKHSDFNVYYAILTPEAMLYAPAEISSNGLDSVVCNADGNVSYNCNEGEWDGSTEYFDKMSVSLDDPPLGAGLFKSEIMWSNHDVLVATELNDDGTYEVGNRIWFDHEETSEDGRCAILYSMLEGLGDAIRSKTGGTELIPVPDMEAQIRGISVKGELQEKEVRPETYAQTVVADEGFDGLSKVLVAATPLEEIRITPTEEEQEFTPTWTNIGFSKVTVGSAAAPKLQFKDVSVAFGATVWVSPDEGYDGLSEVSVVGEKPMSNSTTVSPTAEDQVVYPDFEKGSQFLDTVTVKAVTLEEKSVTPTTEQQVVTPADGYLGFSKVTVEAAEVKEPKLTEITVTPARTASVALPPEGYDGFSKVTVEAAKLQNKVVTPGVKTQAVLPEGDAIGLFQVTVKGAALEEATVTPTTEDQVFTPSGENIGFSKVTVKAAESGGGGVEYPNVMEVSF